MKYRIPVFCLFVLSPLFVFSQGSFSYDIELQHVNFVNGLTIDVDDVTGDYNSTFEYEKLNPGVYKTSPVAYKSGTTFTVEAEFLTSCLEDVFIRGIHIRPDGVELILPEHQITPDGSGILHYTFDQPLDNGNTFIFPNGIVEFHDPFEILWQLSADNNDWVDIHTSAHPLYVTRTTPEFSQPTSNRQFHTYFRTSCKAADGLSDKFQIIDAVWAVFATANSFERADDGVPLTYYGDWTTDVFWADDMIPAADGQCSSHSMAFLNCLKIQGINEPGDYLWVNARLPLHDIDLGILVDNFIPNGSGPFTHWTNNIAPSVPTGFTIEHVVIPEQTGNPYVFEISDFSDPANIVYSEIDDQNGVGGQNQPNPKAVFANHQIITLENVDEDPVYYDVPYGVTYDSLSQMENNLFGYILSVETLVDEMSLNIDLDNSGTLESDALITVWLVDKDPEGLELVKDISNSF